LSNCEIKFAQKLERSDTTNLYTTLCTFNW